MWEYASVVVQTHLFMGLGGEAGVLSEWGKQGWEAVGMTALNMQQVGVLLKRHIPEQ